MEQVAEREIMGQVRLLQGEVARLRGEVAFLEAEVLAVGNLLLKKGMVTLEELRHHTSLALKEKENMERAARSGNPYGKTRREFLEEINGEISAARDGR